MKTKRLIDWAKAIRPLIKKYKNEPHPLHAGNLYEMMVMVVLSAQSTDSVVNSIAPALLAAYPNMQALAKAKLDELYDYIRKIRNFAHKADWLIRIAAEIKTNDAIPLDMATMVKLPGIGRKSANVLKRFAGASVEGIMVDLHTVRVANRLAIVATEDPKKIEQQMMEILPQKEWDAGMAMSFLGRDICRPTNPKCPECVMNKVCAYYNGWL